MSWRKIKVYSKLTLIGIVVLFVLLFMASNRDVVTVQFLWWKTYEVPTFAFMFIVANGGIGVFLIVKRLGKVVTDVKQLRHESRARRALVTEVREEARKEQAGQTGGQNVERASGSAGSNDKKDEQG